MGLGVLIIGESGTGKSASLRNFDPEEYALVNVASKPMPFKVNGIIDQLKSDNPVEIRRFMVSTKKKAIIIDDAQYIMANEFMRRAKEKGFDKFTEIGTNMWNVIRQVESLEDDKVVYFMMHIERDGNNNEKAKTIGHLLDEKITLEGMFAIVLKTVVSDRRYFFSTQNSGSDTVKSPMGLFSTTLIDNDLKMVDDSIRSYYNLGSVVKISSRDTFFNDIVSSPTATAPVQPNVPAIAVTTPKPILENAKGNPIPTTAQVKQSVKETIPNTAKKLDSIEELKKRRDALRAEAGKLATKEEAPNAQPSVAVKPTTMVESKPVEHTMNPDTAKVPTKADLDKIRATLGIK